MALTEVVVLPDVEPHDVVVHVVSVAYVKIAFVYLGHAHLLVEGEGFVVAVDVEEHAAGVGV